MNKTIKKKEKTNSKGITLVALVITIIVLLILAGVTINLTLGKNGIFKTAEMAGKNYTQAQEEELAGLENFENTINNIISGTDTPTTNYDTLASKAQPGDYVKYDTGIDGIGENNDGILIFRVLYNDTTYGLQIISDKNVENIKFGGSGDWAIGRDSYNNAIETLNEAAYDYAENSPYAMDGRCVGSVPTVEVDGTFNAKNTENVGPVELQFTSSVEGANNMKDEDINYTANGAEGVGRDKEAMEAAGLWTTGEDYWLASRNVASYSNECFFYVRDVRPDGDLAARIVCHVSGSDTSSPSSSNGLRPVISLNADVKVVGGGDGSSEAEAYELGI